MPAFVDPQYKTTDDNRVLSATFYGILAALVSPAHQFYKGFSELYKKAKDKHFGYKFLYATTGIVWGLLRGTVGILIVVGIVDSIGNGIALGYTKGFKAGFLTLVNGLFSIGDRAAARVSKTKENIEEYKKEISDFLSSNDFKDKSAVQLKPYIKKCDECSELIQSLSEDEYLLNALNYHKDNPQYVSRNGQLVLPESPERKALEDYSESILFSRTLLLLSAVSRFLKKELEKPLSDISNVNSVEKCENLIQDATQDLDAFLNYFEQKITQLQNQVQENSASSKAEEEDKERYQPLQKREEQLQQERKKIQDVSKEFHLMAGKYFQVIGYHYEAIQEFKKISQSTKEINDTSSIPKTDEATTTIIEPHGKEEVSVSNKSVSVAKSASRNDDSSENLTPPSENEKLRLYIKYSAVMLELISPQTSEDPALVAGNLIEQKAILMQCKESKYNFPQATRSNAEVTIKFIDPKIAKITDKLKIGIHRQLEEIKSDLKALDYLPYITEEKELEALTKKEDILKQGRKSSEAVNIKLKEIAKQKVNLQRKINIRVAKEEEYLKRRLELILNKLNTLTTQCKILGLDSTEIEITAESTKNSLDYLNNGIVDTGSATVPGLIPRVESFLEKKYAQQFGWEELIKECDSVVESLQRANLDWNNSEIVDDTTNRLNNLKNSFTKLLKQAFFSTYFREHGQYRLNNIELLIHIIDFNKKIFNLKNKPIEKDEFDNHLQSFIEFRKKIEGNDTRTKLTQVFLLKPVLLVDEELFMGIKSETVSIQTTMTAPPTPRKAGVLSRMQSTASGHESEDHFQSFPKYKPERNCWQFFDGLRGLFRGAETNTSKVKISPQMDAKPAGYEAGSDSDNENVFGT